MNQETRVRMGAKQNARGLIQLDVTVEALTVDEAGELLDKTIPKFMEKVRKHGLALASDSAT